METAEKTFLDHFADLEDPRSRESRHGLMELLLTAICGVLCGADSWTGVALWGLDHRSAHFGDTVRGHAAEGRVQ